jgi:iron complex outermembrane receptor protein
LHQINLQLAQASFVPGQGIQTKGIVNNRSAQARLLQVPNLKPEKSTNLTLGLGYNPTKDINITVDYFNINVKDRIILSSEIDSTATPSGLNNVLRNNGIVAVSFFTNGINTTTSGIDFVFNWRNIGLGAGKMAVNVAGNYMLGNKLDEAFVSSDLIRAAGKKTFDVIQEALLLSSRPQFKIIWGADYTVNKFNINLNNTVFGPTTFRQNGLNSNLKTVFKTNMVTDLGVNYQFTSKVGLGVNIQNVFNVMPKWELKALNAAGEAILKDAAATQANVNAITFNGRYSNVTYDGSQFSQLGLTAAAQLTVKF